MVERVRGHVRPGTLSLADLAGYRPIKREARVRALSRLDRLRHAAAVVGRHRHPAGAGAARAVRALARPARRPARRCISSPRRAGSPSPTATATSPIRPSCRCRWPGCCRPAYIAERRKLMSHDRSMGRRSARSAARLCRARHQPHDASSIAGAMRSRFTTTIEAPFGAQMMVRGFLLNNELTDFLAVARGRRQAGRQPGRTGQAAALVDVAHLRSSTATASWCGARARPAARASSATRCRR